jgi:hypothetical protein
MALDLGHERGELALDRELRGIAKRPVRVRRRVNEQQVTRELPIFSMAP